MSVSLAAEKDSDRLSSVEEGDTVAPSANCGPAFSARAFV